MGFRHFYGFNLAMLGKQGWKLLTNQDAIIARVFKAKYYPNTGFLEARLSHNPSYVWRSIYSSRVVVKRGVRRRIGDGRSINVWSQPWLRNKDNTFVSSHAPLGQEDLLVADLMHEGTHEWKVELVQQLFQDQDVHEILKIPISYVHGPDKMLWRLSRDGAYSVRSAYHQLMETVIDSQHLRIPSPWKDLWRLKIPNRVRVFVWRAVRGVLPTRQRLVQKSVACDPNCSHCALTVENEWHVFFGCSTAQQVWRESGLWVVIEPLFQVAEGFRELVFSLLSATHFHQQALMVMILWSIWGQRNKKVWDSSTLSELEVVRKATETLEDWSQIRVQQNQHTRSTDGQHIRWQKPREGHMSCNVDAALFSADNCYGIGMCLRNSRGEFVKARTIYLPGAPQVVEAEAVGLLEAITWLLGMNVTNISIELDNLTVVEGVRGNRSNHTEFDSIIIRCKQLWNLSSNFGISYVRRQVNRVAHELARASRFYASRQDFDYMPPCIVDVTLDEMR